MEDVKPEGQYSVRPQIVLYDQLGTALPRH